MVQPWWLFWDASMRRLPLGVLKSVASPFVLFRMLLANIEPDVFGGASRLFARSCRCAGAALLCSSRCHRQPETTWTNAVPPPPPFCTYSRCCMQMASWCKEICLQCSLLRFLHLPSASRGQRSWGGPHL
ncbi:hypothetical protein BKA66DRAFT_470137 [Pyrenochaeta sp. MPI-SDFR-AT-0127]|nr:hypothetical protein BKA66DRAFT_470137 [Pyrenochaeta sp. MPI-SDFR-AT-0127]